MPQKKIKILSSGLVFLFLIVVFVFSDNKSSYLSHFAKTDSASRTSQEAGQVESASVSTPVSPTESSLNQDLNEGTTPEGAETYKVVKVVDGDTVDVDADGTNTRLRIIGIDTPETVDPRKPVQCFGKEASNRAKEILSGQFVTLTADQSQGNTDKYGRLLRYITLPNGSDYGLEMISQGYAHEYTYRLPYEKQADYKQAEIDARNSNLGLWNPSTCNGNK